MRVSFGRSVVRKPSPLGQKLRLTLDHSAIAFRKVCGTGCHTLPRRWSSREQTLLMNSCRLSLGAGRNSFFSPVIPSNHHGQVIKSTVRGSPALCLLARSRFGEDSGGELHPETKANSSRWSWMKIMSIMLLFL